VRQPVRQPLRQPLRREGTIAMLDVLAEYLA